MLTKKLQIKLALALMASLCSAQSFAARCNDAQLAEAARTILFETQGRHFSGGAPRSWELITNPAPTLTVRGNLDLYSIEMGSDGGYTVPVYIWTSVGECNMTPSSVHVNWNQGDDG